MNPKRIFIGFSEVAGYYTNLTKGFEKLGIAYLFITFGQHKFRYGNTEATVAQKVIHYLIHKYTATSKRNPLWIIWFILYGMSRVSLFLWVLLRYDVFIFSYNASFFGFYDLPLLKFFRKKIIYVYHGSDNRPPYLNGSYIHSGYPLEQIFTLTKKLYEKNKKVEKYADHIITAPCISQFFNRELIQYLAIGAPVDLSYIQDINHTKGTRIKIVHAPSGRKQKGSDDFAQIIKELINEGYPIDYEELFNVPNRVVLEKLSACDFVLDELYSDTTLAGLGTEAAYFGKPTIVGGYYHDMAKDLKETPLPPSLYVDPAEIKQAIVKLIEDVAYRNELGEQAKKYVDTYWSPKEVASRYLRLFYDDVPEEWLYHPKEVDYFYGWAVSKDDLQKFLKEYIATFGKAGLFLPHNPQLENKILDFIKD